MAAPELLITRQTRSSTTFKEFILTGVLTELVEMTLTPGGTSTSKRMTERYVVGIGRRSPNSLRGAGVRVKDDLKIGKPTASRSLPPRTDPKLAFLKAININGRLVQMVAL